MTERYETTWDESGEAGTPGMEDPPPRPDFFKRMWMVIVQPGELFRALAANPAWFPMAAFVALVAAVGMAVIPADAFYETIAANTPPEQMGDLRDVPASWLKWPWVAGVALAMLVGPVFLSLVSYVIFVFIRGDRATFKQHLCVMAHASVISALGVLVAAPVRIGAGNVQDTLALGDLTPFLDGYLYNLLSLLDLFALWATVVAGLGLSVIDPRRRWGTTAAVLVVIFVVMMMGLALFLP